MAACPTGPPVRAAAVEPALVARGGGGAAEWQYRATGSHLVPRWVRRAAAAVTIAVIDTGADLAAPDLGAKSPVTHSVVSADARDAEGHGTFVAALAAGADSNREGIAGFGGAARLLVVRAGDRAGELRDDDVAAAIVYAVDRGARIVNLSFAGTRWSAAEASAVRYAAARDVLLVAAAGNSFGHGNPVQYPAALLEPAGSRGVGGIGLVVGASTEAGRRAAFSSTRSVSLVAPGVGVTSAVAAASSPADYPRIRLRGSRRGVYALGSGTSFAAPQVAGAAALVWAANPALSARQVAETLERTARRRGGWTPQVGWGVLDVGAAVSKALRTRAGARSGVTR